MNIRLIIATVLAVCTALWGMPGTAHGQMAVSINGTGSNGGGSIVQYTPDGTQSFFPGLDRPRGLVFDNTLPPTGPNLFVATNTRGSDGLIHGTIFKITPDGVKSPFATGFPADFFVQGLALDSAGYVFVAGADNSAPNFTYPTTIYKVPPGGTVSPSPFGFDPNCNCSVPGDARQLAFDSSGTLYASDGTFNTIYTFTPGGDRSVFPQSFNESGVSFITFDILGDLFGSIENPPYDTTTSLILKLEPNGMVSQFGPGLANPRALAFDSAGNLFVTDIPASTGGKILEFTPGGAMTTFASGIGTTGNSGPEYLAFPPGAVTPVRSGVTLNFPAGTGAETTTVTLNPSPSPTPSPSEFQLGDPPLAFDITASPAPTTGPIIIAFQVPQSFLDQCGCDVSTLRVLHGTALEDVTCPIPNPGPTPDTTTNTVYASVSSLSPFVIAKLRYGAQVQQPINADGTSVFSVRRGVVPVKFTLTQDGAATCALPAATIALTRTSGGTTGAIDESVYSGSADTGSNFRIGSCQYLYNLSASALGVGTYRADIKINGTVVGNAIFQLK